MQLKITFMILFWLCQGIQPGKGGQANADKLSVTIADGVGWCLKKPFWADINYMVSPSSLVCS